MSKLAIMGGTPVLFETPPPFNTIRADEVTAAAEVVASGMMSGYIATSGEGFDGGPAAQKLERQWEEKFSIDHAIAINSATSGLVAAMGAIGISPGDEVIVPPYTMSATVIAPLAYGGIPVFVDIDPDTYCFAAGDVAAAITPSTRAIVAVNLFGLPAELIELRALADKHGIHLIEDNAQAPLARQNGRLAGTIGHIGIFSLNRHKHIQTGEGGICVTSDPELALRLRLIRNHGEVAVEDFGIDDITNLIGFNLRITEMAAAVGSVQLGRATDIIDETVRYAERLSDGLRGLDGFAPPHVPEDRIHVYYSWAGRYDEAKTGVPRQLFAKALQAEGFNAYEAYVQPLYMLPTFQRRRAIGRDGFPFTLTDRIYGPGLCPNCESLYERELLGYPICAYTLSEEIVEKLIEAFHKVHAERDALAAMHHKASAA